MKGLSKSSKISPCLSRETMLQSRINEKIKLDRENAITERIRTSKSVEIIEYAEGSGEGKFGVGRDNIGVQGGGERVQKRIIRFSD